MDDFYNDHIISVTTPKNLDRAFSIISLLQIVITAAVAFIVYIQLSHVATSETEEYADLIKIFSMITTLIIILSLVFIPMAGYHYGMTSSSSIIESFVVDGDDAVMKQIYPTGLGIVFFFFTLFLLFLVAVSLTTYLELAASYPETYAAYTSDEWNWEEYSLACIIIVSVLGGAGIINSILALVYTEPTLRSGQMVDKLVNPTLLLNSL